ncbi:hypothetical protein Syun_015060 [Stephania yunnanensis]|uniref:NAC domain-containing protein n=1 Tax=Stephania yunnanensis TaxID=152371 RepID=A0AAP0PCH7_9MAGN
MDQPTTPLVVQRLKMQKRITEESSPQLLDPLSRLPHTVAPPPAADPRQWRHRAQLLRESPPFVRKKRAKEWYFFSPRIMKHENGSRPNRKVAGQSSFWRASNGGKMMVQVHNRQFLGHKGALNYFKNKQSKTNWIMQEYTLASQNHHGPHKIIHQAVPFIATDDNDCGNSSNFGLSNIEPHHADPEEAGAIIQDYQEKYQCDFNTDHPDVVAPPNVESTEVLEEEGLDWLRDFPKFQPADLEFSDWEANAWDNEFAPV